MEAFEAGCDVGAEVDAEGTAAAVGEDLEVAPGLRGLDYAEGVAMAGDGEVDGIVAGDLQEHARVGAAFVGLAGRVQEARAEAERRCDVARIPHGVSDRLDLGLMGRA